MLVLSDSVAVREAGLQDKRKVAANSKTIILVATFWGKKQTSGFSSMQHLVLRTHLCTNS